MSDYLYITGSAAKKIADDVNRELCKDILEKIDEASRNGEYSVRMVLLDKNRLKQITYLKNNGFLVEGYQGEYTIRW